MDELPSAPTTEPANHQSAELHTFAPQTESEEERASIIQELETLDEPNQREEPARQDVQP